jgi:hypothetical protein
VRHKSRSVPDTWLRFIPTTSVTHKADEPDPIVGLFDSDGLPGEDLAEIDFLPIEADAAADCDGGTPVMVIDLRIAASVTQKMRTARVPLTE